MNQIFSTLLLLLSALSQCSAAVLRLNDSDYKAKTAGKTVFLKMYAPWCGHCKAMAPDFERLANDWAGHDIALVAEVDCTADDSEEICDKFNVEGFPTLLYGDPDAPEDFQGGRDYESMSNFAKTFIDKPVCSVDKTDACSPEQKKIIESLLAKSKDDLLKEEAAALSKISAATKELEDYSDYINAQFEAKNQEISKKILALKEESNFKWVHQVLTKVHGLNRKNPDDSDDEDSDADDEDDDSVGDEL